MSKPKKPTSKVEVTDLPSDPNRPAVELPVTDGGGPPKTITYCLPAGGGPGGFAMWDGFNWKVLPPPTVIGAVLTWGANGPYWASPP